MHGLDSAIHLVVQASKKNCQVAKYHQRPNAPWRRTICMQVNSLRSAMHAGWFQERIAKHAWENWSLPVIDPVRRDLQRQARRRNYSARRAASAPCAPSCATFACAQIDTTSGRARGISSWVCCMLHIVRCMLYVAALYVVCVFFWLLF